jgi:hypothetical protein
MTWVADVGTAGMQVDELAARARVVAGGARPSTRWTSGVPTAAVLDAGCDDLAVCADSPACPLPCAALARGRR